MQIKSWIYGGLIVVATGATSAEAYGYRTCGGRNLRMPSNQIIVRSSTASFPTGYWKNGLQDAVVRFNAHPSNMFYTRVDDTGGVALRNGQNEVWGSTSQSILQGAPAIAYSSWDCFWTPFTGWVVRMKEGDVIFDYTNTAANPFEWTANTTKSSLGTYTGRGRLLQATAIHEFGHAAGLRHENRVYNVMGADFSHVHTNGITTRAYAGEDTGNGFVFLYGLWAAGPQDFGVAHWRRSGASGEYSSHARTRVFNTSGAVLPTVMVAGEVGHQVRRGQQVRPEFTYENNGRATGIGIPLRYFISTNDLISTSDRLIATSSITLARDVPTTASVTVTIPSNLTVNTNYWLGVMINPVGTGESNTSNNATYIPIRVIP